MAPRIPRLSRFETQCLRALAALGEGSVRDLLDALPDPPSYSTVRKIVERLEAKGAVARLRLDGKAWVYRATVGSTRILRREIQDFLDSFFDGSAAPLVSHLAEMNALSLEDLREVELQIGAGPARRKKVKPRD